MGFFMALFAGLFQASVYSKRDKDVINAYEFIIKLLGCIFLACSANVLKTLCAKLLSNHFYQDSYFEKMQNALCKVSSPLHAIQERRQCLKSPFHTISREEDIAFMMLLTMPSKCFHVRS